jgi:hypothetical protein
VLRKYKFIGKDMIISLNKLFTYFLLPERLLERVELHSWWLDVLTKSKKQEFEQVVHMSWERGSVYFDTVKMIHWRELLKENRAKRDLRFHQW